MLMLTYYTIGGKSSLYLNSIFFHYIDPGLSNVPNMRSIGDIDKHLLESTTQWGKPGSMALLK